MFQQNQLEDVRTNITVWLTSMAIQVNKLKKLNHVLDEEYQITHILASLPREYSSVVEQVKIDRRTGSTLITMDEIKKRLKERYLQLKREHHWCEDEMVLTMKSSNNQNKNIKKGSKGKYFKGRCNHCGKFGHKKADCWDLKNKKGSIRKMRKRSRKINQKLDVSSVESWVIMQMSAKMTRTQVGMARMTPLPRHVMRTLKMIKMGMGMMRTSKNQRILKMMKETWVLEHPGTLKNPKEPHCRSHM